MQLKTSFPTSSFCFFQKDILHCLQNWKDMDRKAKEPPLSEPSLSGPALSGSAVCEPAVSGPALSDPALSGPALPLPLTCKATPPSFLKISCSYHSSRSRNSSTGRKTCCPPLFLHYPWEAGFPLVSMKN